MNSGSSTGLAGVVLTLTLLLFIFWVMLGAPSSKAKAGRRELGHLITLPTRDRDWIPLGFITALAANDLAGLVVGADYSLGSAVLLGCVVALAAGMPKPVGPLVQQLLGLCGAIVAAASLIFGDRCAAGIDEGVRAAIALTIVGFLLVVAVLRLIVAPVRPAVAHSAARPSLLAVYVVVQSGVFFAQLWSRGLVAFDSVSQFGLVVALSLVIAFGLALLPAQTTSVLGAALGVTALFLAILDPVANCVEPAFLVLALGFAGVSLLARRTIGPTRLRRR